MMISLEMLRAITLGVADIKETEKGIVFSRFSDVQMDLYYNHAAEYQKCFDEKARFPAGVKLSFKTNSSSLYLRGLTHKTIGVRRFFSVDVKVNGKYLDSMDNFSHQMVPEDYINTPYMLGIYEKTFDLGVGEKHVCIYLPWCVEFYLQQLQLDDGATIEPVKPAKKLLVYGDSITQGYDVLRPYKRPLTCVAEMLDAEEVCKAIGGERFFPALARIRENYTPDYIYVAYGTNDWSNSTRETFLRNSKEFYAVLRELYPQTPILAVTPIWRKNYLDQKEVGPFADVEQGIRDAVAELPNVHVIRGFDFVPHDEKYYSDLRLHPNARGFEHYAENLCDAVREILK